jgi:hypothetical protein
MKWSGQEDPVPLSHEPIERNFEHEILLMNSHKNEIWIREAAGRKGKWDNPSGIASDLHKGGVSLNLASAPT